MPKPSSGPSLPWWRVPTVWLVVGGPAAVVVASFVTLVMAVRGGDPVLPTGSPVSSATQAADEVSSHTPALQARNHANSPRP